jgi:hypothetical protein
MAALRRQRIGWPPRLRGSEWRGAELSREWRRGLQQRSAQLRGSRQLGATLLRR